MILTTMYYGWSFCGKLFKSSLKCHLPTYDVFYFESSYRQWIQIVSFTTDTKIDTGITQGEVLWEASFW